MGSCVSVRVPCQLSYRDLVGALIVEVCRDLEARGEPSGLRHQVLSAFVEAFNNLLLHETGPLEEKRVQVDVEVVDGCLVVEVRDNGTAFDLKSAERRALEPLAETGRGLYIMRSFMSDLTYTPGVAGQDNLLRLIRELRKEERP